MSIKAEETPSSSTRSTTDQESTCWKDDSEN